MTAEGRAVGTSGVPVAGPMPAAHRHRPRPVVVRAGTVVAAAGAIGLAGQLLFFDVGLGINFPIAIGLLLFGGWVLRRRTPSLTSPDAWLGPAAMAFALFAAIRADATIVALDVMTALALAGLALAALGGFQVTDRAFGQLVALAARAIGWALGGAIAALASMTAAWGPAPVLAQRARPALPIVRGLLLAIPIVLIFIALFSSADAVFARVIGDAFRIDLDLSELIARALMASVIGWVAAGGIALAAAAHDSAASSHSAASSWRVGTTEAVTVLVAVNLVFLLFVGLQAAYLFGGLDTLEASGLTYADYARRGFFELVVAAVLAAAVVIGAERLAAHRTRSLVAAGIGLALLTGVILASAALRLRLYQEAYGWTELRLYVLATIALLAIGLIALLAQLIVDRVRWFGHVMLGAALAIGLILNVIGPIRFITDQNVARVLDPSLVPANGRSGLDEAYALSLGDDGIPALVRAMPHVDNATRGDLAHELNGRLRELRDEPGLTAWQAWNAGRNQAREALEAAAARGDLR